MKNGHINTAIKALQRQIDKYHKCADYELDKSKDHQLNAEFYLKQADLLNVQIKTLSGESVEEKQPVGEKSVL